MQIVLDFLSEESAKITKLLTNSHHKLLADFMEFKSRNAGYMRERERVLDNWRITEIALAQKTPVMEAEFAMDEKSPLSLFDCLKPMIKHNRRMRIDVNATLSAEDYRELAKARQLKWNLQ